MSFLRIELRDDSEPRPVEEEHRVEVVVAAGPGEGGGVGLELAVHAGPAVPGVAVHGAVHGLHLQDALDGVPDADVVIVSVRNLYFCIITKISK